MSNFKFVLNGAGVREMLKWGETADACMQHANRIRNNCGDGYVVESRSYQERSGAAVFPDTYEAKKDNFRNNTLLRNLHG